MSVGGECVEQEEGMFTRGVGMSLEGGGVGLVLCPIRAVGVHLEV